MSDLISRQAAIDAVHSTIFDFFETDEDDSDSPMTDSDERLLELNKAISTSIRAIDPVKQGKWIYKGERGLYPVCECSVCGNEENYDWAILGNNVNYCPNCGAKMR